MKRVIAITASLMIAILLAVLVFIQFHSNSRAKKSPGMQVSWQARYAVNRPVVFQGSIEDSEWAYMELKDALRVSNKPADRRDLESWIQLQIDILSNTSQNIAIRQHDRYAIQELAFYPGLSLEHEAWVRQYAGNRSSSSHIHAVVESFDVIKARWGYMPSVDELYEKSPALIYGLPPDDIEKSITPRQQIYIE